jgi:hypothetical protein
MDSARSTRPDGNGHHNWTKPQVTAFRAVVGIAIGRWCSPWGYPCHFLPQFSQQMIGHFLESDQGGVMFDKGPQPDPRRLLSVFPKVWTSTQRPEAVKSAPKNPDWDPTSRNVACPT